MSDISREEQGSAGAEATSSRDDAALPSTCGTGPVSATLILGGPASGKTAALAERARELAGAVGASKDEVLFVCASPKMAETVRAEVPPTVTVADARSFALRILENADAGRTRLLQPYEEQFLFEDLRTCGLPQKQIRKVLEFVYATMASCGDWAPGWIEMREERLVYDTLMDALAFTGGTVEPEVAGRAAHLLEHDSELRAREGFQHVLVDDYGLLNRSSQLMCNLIARTSITVAGEPGFSLAVHDSHPNPAGLDEFAAMHPGATTAQLGRRGSATSNASSHPHEKYVVYTTLKDEFDAIVAQVKDALASGIAPQRIAVMGANGTWTRNIARYLEGHGDVAVQQPDRHIRIRDFRDEKSCSAAHADTLAHLAENPADGVALRSLFGFGDYLARSVEVKRFRETHPGAAITDLVPAPSPEALAQGAAVTSAAAPHEPDSGIWVGDPRQSFGHHFDLVIFGGLVPGWIPATGFADAVGAKREHMMQDAALTVDCARRATCERGTLVFSSFAECDLEFAERLGLNYKRSRLRNGVRTCELSPAFEAIPELFGTR